MISGNGTRLQEPDMTTKIIDQAVCMTNSSRIVDLTNLRVDVDGKIDQKNRDFNENVSGNETSCACNIKINR